VSPEDGITREMQAIELALLRDGVDRRAAGRDRCSRCSRTPLVGERVYVYDGAGMVCELCCSLERGTPMSSRLVHGPAFGQTIRILDQRAA
jgi:hypothetical protein